MDAGGPKFQVNPKNIPGGKKAKTMGDLIVNILRKRRDGRLDRGLVRNKTLKLPVTPWTASISQVAIIIPSDFSEQFADIEEGKAVIEFYQDPTLTIGPAIMKSIMNRFLQGMSGVKIAVDVFTDEADTSEYAQTGLVVQRYLDESLALSDDLEGELLDVHAPTSKQQSKAEKTQNVLLGIVGPIMGGMMVFYAFYTGASTAQSILREEEERTLPRLFTTPTPQATILTGKLLSVFITVCIQVVVLLLAAHLIFKIQWGALQSVALIAAGTIVSASSFGIFFNSFLKSTKQAGVLFGGVLTVTGMLGMIRVFATNSPGSAVDIVSLLVPQGWAIRGIVQSMHGETVSSLLITSLVMLAWSVVFFIVGVWRFNRRYV